MIETNIVEAITERDIDMLILEELNISIEFGKWFYRRNQLPKPIPNIVKAYHSISDAQLGESDLVLLYENSHAILVENKISAYSQPAQANRYVLRGEKGISSAFWKTFSTCIIAPNNYLVVTDNVNNYQIKVSYETIIKWFNTMENPRGKYRSYILNEAIEQNRRGYTIIPDVQVSSFWQEYWEYATKNYPKLNMKKPGAKPANSTFIYFFPDHLPKGYQLIHKVAHGFMDLQIANMADRLDLITDIFSDMEIEITPAGKSIAFRERVTKMDAYAPFKNQNGIVDTALQYATKLFSMTSKISSRISSEF